MKTEMLSHKVSPSVTVSTSKNGKSITVTSDKFALAAGAVRDSQRQEMSVMGVRGQAFADCTPSEKTAMRDMFAKLSLANIVLAIRLWREGMAECSEYIRNRNFDPGIKVTVKVPKILNGELNLGSFEENAPASKVEKSPGVLPIAKAS
jgi:hypothetical protein